MEDIERRHDLERDPDKIGTQSIGDIAVAPSSDSILWVGTEVGVFVSFDGGDSWLAFNNGLPPVGVRMMAHAYTARDLVIGTFGRGIWVNHIGPLQEMNDTLLDQKAHLFEITSAYLTRSVNTYGAIGSKDFIASNPPQGAVLRYYLKDSADKDVKLIVTNEAGDTVRTLTNRGYPGLHSVTWDLKRQQPPAPPSPARRAQRQRRAAAGEARGVYRGIEGPWAHAHPGIRSARVARGSVGKD